MDISPEVVILPAYDEIQGIPSESAPWHEIYEFEHKIESDHMPKPMYYDERGVGLYTTGISKSESAASVAALLANDRLDLSETIFLTVGVAGAPPDFEIGSVILSETIIDWDDKCRVGPDSEDIPLLLNPYTKDKGYYELNQRLITAALDTLRDIKLPAAVDGHGGAQPRIRTGVNVCADEFWHGEEIAKQVEWLVDQYDAGKYCVTEVEDAGTAAALKLFGNLEKYLCIRAVSNYDRPLDGTSPRHNVFTTDFHSGFAIGIDNAIVVARTIVEDELA